MVGRSRPSPLLCLQKVDEGRCRRPVGLRMIFCAAEFYILPISHIHIIYVLRQRMLVVRPINACPHPLMHVAAVSSLVRGAATSSHNFECSSLKYPKLSSNRFMSLSCALSSIRIELQSLGRSVHLRIHLRYVPEA